MVFVEDAPARPVLRAPRFRPLRLYLTAHAAVVMITAGFGVGLFALWVALVAVSPITLVAPLLVPATALVRAYANAHRRGAARWLGGPVEAGYLDTEGLGLAGRVWTLVRDPGSWRDAAWLLLHAVVGIFVSVLSVTLLLSTVFYLIYPFLFWVTPEHVFNRPFGDTVHLHTVGQAAGMMPIGLVTFGLWYALAIPLARAELSITRGLLAHR